jgi:hypothetical protein
MIGMGQRSLRGVFDPRLFAFTSLEAGAAPVRVTLDGGGFSLGLATASLTHAAGPLSRTRWVTQTNVALTGLGATLDGVGTMAVAEASLSQRLQDIDLARYGAFARATGADPLAFFPRFGRVGTEAEMLANLFDGVGLGQIETESRLSGVAATYGGSYRATMREFSSQSTLSDLAGGRASYGGRLSLKDMALPTGLSPLYQRFVPRTLEFEFTAANLPLADTLRLMRSQRTDAAPQFVSPLGRLRELATGSNVTFELKPSRIESPALDLALTGVAAADAAVSWGGRAALAIEVSGLQQAAAALRQATNDREAIAAAAALLVLQGIGKPVEPNGRAAGKLRYDLAFDGRGAFLVNGLDVGLLMSLIAPQGNGGRQGR